MPDIIYDAPHFFLLTALVAAFTRKGMLWARLPASEWLKILPTSARLPLDLSVQSGDGATLLPGDASRGVSVLHARASLFGQPALVW